MNTGDHSGELMVISIVSQISISGTVKINLVNEEQIHP